MCVGDEGDGQHAFRSEEMSNLERKKDLKEIVITTLGSQLL